MGIEYRQFLVVNDAKWLPERGTASRVVKVLREWGLAEKLREYIRLKKGKQVKLTEAYDLTDGQETPISEKEIEGDPGHGKAFVFAGVEGPLKGPPVERITGPSAYDNVVSRYTDYTALVIGTDYRICTSNEGVYFKLTSPPQKNRKPIAPHTYSGYDSPLHNLWDQSFPCDEKTIPPTVEIIMEDWLSERVKWKGVLGYWRGAVVIDFNKDVPAFAEKNQLLPNRKFVHAVQDAFRAEIKEIGEYS